MPLISFFTSPKPFTDPHISLIQSNAIRSWLDLGSKVEVILVGAEPGVKEFADELKIILIEDVRRNDSGTPLVSSIFTLARQASQNPFLAYINADIILLPDLIRAVQQVAEQEENFLLIGQRWDLDIANALEFTPDWEHRIREKVSKNGILHLPAGSDFFVFPRSLFQDIPDFAIGRAGWDNWMIYHAKQQNYTVVDATPSITVIHQNHDYSHLPGGAPHYLLEESDTNEELAGGMENLFMVLDSDKELRDGLLHNPQVNLIWMLRRAEVWLYPRNGKYVKIRKYFSRRFRRIRRRMTGSL